MGVPELAREYPGCLAGPHPEVSGGSRTAAFVRAEHRRTNLPHVSAQRPAPRRKVAALTAGSNQKSNCALNLKIRGSRISCGVRQAAVFWPITPYVMFSLITAFELSTLKKSKLTLVRVEP